MISWQRMSIRNKVAFALVGVALPAFVAASVGLSLLGRCTLKGRARKVMEPYAHLISVGTEAAVAFEDPRRAREILETLQTSPQVLKAAIILRDGKILAEYIRKQDASSPKPAQVSSRPLQDDSLYLNQDNAELRQRLGDGASLQLVMSLDELNRQTQNAILGLSIGLFVLLLATTLGLRLTLQRAIVRPLLRLVETVEQVSTRADYSRRVPAAGVDEVARLGRSFNVMMETIRERTQELHQMTRFQRAILDNAAHGIISTTPDGIVSSFNPAAERLLGYSAEAVVGKLTPLSWHDPQEISWRARQLSEKLGETVLPGVDVFTAGFQGHLPVEHEWTFIRRDGTRVPVLLSVSALRDESDQVTGYVGLTYDMTERRQAEDEICALNQDLEQRVSQRTAELAAANTKLLELDRLKSMFIASMSHELRTPLNSIIGFSSIMLNEWSGPVNAEQKENLQTVLRSGRHLLSLINDVIDVSKIETGKIEAIIEDFDVYGLVEEAVESLRKDIEKKGLELVVRTPHLTLHADRRRLLQCLLNLLSNAVKFTWKGSIAIQVQASEDGSTLTIAVEDTGIGIAEEDLERLCSPFTRFHQAGEAVVPGTGLGLYLTQKLVQDILKGEMLAKSTFGVGSRFTLRLPLSVQGEK
ncbi:MAG: PAS domain S-box protein [Deltaproteobacteria bacterium]|nr:PAS domain S-box protein [Deltaproteobacteria bacterium]